MDHKQGASEVSNNAQKQIIKRAQSKEDDEALVYSKMFKDESEENYLSIDIA